MVQPKHFDIFPPSLGGFSKIYIRRDSIQINEYEQVQRSSDIVLFPKQIPTTESSTVRTKVSVLSHLPSKQCRQYNEHDHKGFVLHCILFSKTYRMGTEVLFRLPKSTVEETHRLYSLLLRYSWLYGIFCWMTPTPYPIFYFDASPSTHVLFTLLVFAASQMCFVFGV